MSLRSRIARLKEIPFERAFRAVCVDRSFELAELPAWLCCPIHGPERTPSLIVRAEFWYCHGACKQGGDALDFLVALEGLDLGEAVARLEAILGVSDDPAEAALSRARAPSRPVTELERGAWERVVGEIEEEVLARARSLCCSSDPIARGIAEGPLDYACNEIDLARRSSPPLVSRLRRELLRDLRSWALDLVVGAERAVERATGRDRLDLALLSRAPDLARVRARAEGARPCATALLALQKRRKPRRPQPS